MFGKCYKLQVVYLLILLSHNCILLLYLESVWISFWLSLIYRLLFIQQSPTKNTEREFRRLDIWIIDLLLISFCAVVWSCEIFFFLFSLTYVVAMPFYSASLIETVQVRDFYTSSLGLYCVFFFFFLKTLQTPFHVLGLFVQK